MKIARILYPVQVLGPGKRIGIWVCGCKRGCRECANPELWDFDPKKELSMDAIRKMLSGILDKQQVDGITISGGEPFLQTEELDELVRFLKRYTDDILIFTGYRRRILLNRKRLLSQTRHILDAIAVLVDGEYIPEKNMVHPLRGSENQKLYYRDEQVRHKYEVYIEEEKGKMSVQNFQTYDGILSVGIHQRDFNKQFKQI